MSLVSFLHHHFTNIITVAFVFTLAVNIQPVSRATEAAALLLCIGEVLHFNVSQEANYID
jgi:hypothetical protein